MINYHHLAESIDFYQEKNFSRIEAPWWVTKEISDLTKPPGIMKDYYIPENNKVLVASAEQSFLYLANKGHLTPGKYQATTPCFRNEPIDLLHRKHFIKNELINTQEVSIKSLEEMISQAQEFFNKYIAATKIKIIKVDSHQAEINYDLVALVGGEELELGSYGIRRCEILRWVYGTGCAEPRLSLILNRLKISEGVGHE